MLIEEAFQKYIKHLNILKPKNDKKFDIELKELTETTQLIDISDIFDSKITNIKIKNIAIPFKNTFIKIKNNPFMICGHAMTHFFIIQEIEDEVGVYYGGIVIYQDTNIVMKISCKIEQQLDDVKIYFFENGYFDENRHSIGRAIETIKQVLAALEKISYSTHDLYKTSSKKMVFKNITKKKKIKLEKPIYIYLNKKDSETKVKTISDYSDRKIERLSSWNVRGHWRRLDDTRKRGKNSEGKYIVEGYTWVKPHICGNKDLPPKQQTYIVIDKSK